MSYLKEVGILRYQFEKVEISQISRGNNSHANSLATLASSVANPLLRIVSVESSVSSSKKAIILSIHPSLSWMDPFVAYLQEEILPEDRK